MNIPTNRRSNRKGSGLRAECHYRTVPRLAPSYILIALLIAAAPARAQVTAALEPQPPEVFKAVFGSNNKKITLYQVEICNNGPASATIHAGRIYAAAQAKGIPTISALLVGAVVLGAENRSWLRMSIDVARWGAWAATVLTGSNALSVPATLKAAMPLIAEGNSAAATYLLGKVVDPGPIQRQFLDGLMQLSPGACQSSLLMASKLPNPAALTLEVSVPIEEPGLRLFLPPASTPATVPPASGESEEKPDPPLRVKNGNFIN